MRIYLIRHADPYYPDDSLTPAGLLEAQALADHLAETGIDEIYCSPRGRARLTAQFTAARLQLPVAIEPWTAELDGLRCDRYQRTAWDVDGLVLRSPEVVAAAQVLSAPDGPLAGNPPDPARPLPPPLDLPRLHEHLRAIRAGSDDFLLRLGYRRQGNCYQVLDGPSHNGGSAPPKPRRIALFAHLGFGLTWLAQLLEIPLPLMWAGFYLHPSSVTTLLFEERVPGVAAPRLVGLGDISHLHCAGLPPSNKGLIANTD